jgi:apolipoprotein N-acyltransferase
MPKFFESKTFLCVLSGLMLGLSFPSYPIFHLEVLAWVGFVPLLFALHDATDFRTAYRYIFTAMFCMTIASVWWVVLSTPAGGVLMYFAQSFFMTIPLSVFYVVHRVWKTFLTRPHGKFWSRVAAWRVDASLFFFPLVWTAWEWIYIDWEISFGWITLGNSQSNLIWMIQYVDMFGVWGISFWLCLFNILAFVLVQEFLTQRQSGAWLTLRLVGLAFLMAVPPMLYSAWRLSEPESPIRNRIKVSIIQGNIDPWAKWNPLEERSQFQKHIQLTDSVMQQKPDFVLWSETSIPFYILYPNYQSDFNTLRDKIDSWQVPLLTGFSDVTFYASPEQAKRSSRTDSRGVMYDYFNSSMLLVPHYATPQVYHKMKLVPFGERVPYLEQLPFLQNLLLFNVGISNWQIGEGVKTFAMAREVFHNGYSLDIPTDSVRVAGLICYESIYPAFVASFVSHGANFIAIITNDGWFSKSEGPYQHAAFARLRAIENRRPIARCANTGISLFIDKMGRTHGQLPWWIEATTTDFITIETEQSFYTRHPDVLPLLCLYLTSVILAAVGFLYVTQHKAS